LEKKIKKIEETLSKITPFPTIVKNKIKKSNNCGKVID